MFSRHNRGVTYNVWNKLGMSLARLWKARSYRRSEFSRVAKRDAWIISVCIWACLKNAFYGWTPSIIKFHRRAVERKYCLDQTHENVGPSFLASWLAFFCDWCQKKTEKIKKFEPPIRMPRALVMSRFIPSRFSLGGVLCCVFQVFDSLPRLRDFFSSERLRTLNCKGE